MKSNKKLYKNYNLKIQIRLLLTKYFNFNNILLQTNICLKII